MRKLVPIFFIIIFLTQTSFALCDQALVISWDGDSFRANNTFVRIDGRDTYSYDGPVEDIAFKGRLYTYEEIDNMVKDNKYDTVFFIYYDGYNSFKLQGNPDDLPDILDDAEIAARRYGYTWNPPVKKDTAPREIVVTYDSKKESVVTAENTKATSTVSAYDYDEPQGANGSVIFLFGLIIIGVIAYAVSKSNQMNNTFVHTQQIHSFQNNGPDPIALKRIDLGLELNSIMERFMNDDSTTLDPHTEQDNGDDNYQSPNANETLPKGELIGLIGNYLAIRGVIPDRLILNDILDEERPVSENISTAAAFYDSSSKEFIIENLTDQEVGYMLNLCKKYLKNEPDALKTIHYLIFGEPFEMRESQ